MAHPAPTLEELIVAHAGNVARSAAAYATFRDAQDAWRVLRDIENNSAEAFATWLTETIAMGAGETDGRFKPARIIVDDF